MTQATSPGGDATSPLPAESQPDPRRWLALGVIATAQLMVILDTSIVAIALPHAQADLHISTASRQWVVTAYTLAFGGLLLLGGRVADFGGRKRFFIWGLIGFAAASALGGAAPNAGLLFFARALQGACGAVLAPAALSLITVTFTEGRERARAFGVYGAISGGGAALGLIVGGLLTEYASWRWCLLLNVPIALVAALAAIPVVQESRSGGGVGYDIMGAVTVTIGLVGLVYGFTRAAQDGWDTAGTVLVVAVAVVLLVAFVVTEVRSAAPLLPMRVPLERNRGGAYLASLLIGASLLALFLFLTFYFQQTLGYSALRTGFAFLPLSLGVMASSGLSSYLLPRVGPRPLMAGGAAAMTAGLLMLTRIDVDTGYLSRVLPAEIVISIGMGLGFVPMSSSSLIGVDPQDAGVASALVNTTQQVGGSLGTALLNTIYATAATGYLKDHSSDSRGVTESQVTGYTTAFTWSAALIGIAFVVILLLVGSGKDLTAARKEPMHAS